MSRETFKADGLDEMRQLMLTQGKKRTRADFARHFGVHRSTINNWLISLEARGCIVEEDEQRRLFLDRDKYLTHLKLSRDESVLLMLALRLLQQYLDKPNAHAVNLLYKLGHALHKGLAPDVGRHVQNIADIQRRDLPVQRPSPDPQRILELVSQAWLDSRKIRIRYRSLRGRNEFNDIFHPYLLEPSAIGRCTYMVGFSQQAQTLRVYKIERITHRPLILDEEFTVPSEIDIHRILQGAWGIWFDKTEQPVEVCLKFSSYVRQRVEENRWHPSERTEPVSDGGLMWIAEIDEPQEMLPWIRGWGADVEVLAPESLRQQMLGEIRRQMRMYGIADSQNNPVQPDTDMLGFLLGGTP